MVEVTVLKRRRISLAATSLAALLVLTGCPGKPASESPDDRSAVASNQTTSQPGDAAETSGVAQLPDEVSHPELDAEALDANGQVVLRSEEPATETNVDDVIVDIPARPADAKEGTPTIAAAKKESPETVSPDSGKAKAKLPAEANVATEAERHQVIAEGWPDPQAVLFVTGQQHGYLEPCGCTGLDQQKGGLIRRDTLLESLRERGWDMIPLDVGNQVRRIGRQPQLKFQTTVTAFNTMGYQAATLGIDDLQLSSVELVSIASTGDVNQTAFIASNLTILDPSFFPGYRIIEAGGRKIGVTAVLGKEFEGKLQSEDIEFFDPVERLTSVVEKLKKQECDFIVLLAHASIEESSAVTKAVPGIDLVVTAGGFGEPTLNPEPIEGSDAVMVQVGTKGMYAGIVGLFDDVQQPIRYQKIAISSQFEDSKRMLKEFEAYQLRLKEAGLDGLGVHAVAHPTGREFVGSESCGDCHTAAFEVWENSPHFEATESIVNPPNDRGGIPRHFDPECIACHVTGWNPIDFHPYKTGYMSLKESEHLLGSGCENCHGPGASHAAAENGDIDADNELLEKLREQMKLPLDKARNKCMECHDLDNSPDFHTDGAFDEYWEKVKHHGLD